MTGLEDAGKGMVIIGVLLAGAQILVAMLNLTGIGVTLSTLVVSVAGEQVFLVALIVAVICLIMGMGIPTTAAYVLVAAVLAPALTRIGIEPLVAHLFVFYFATISVITPPVCIAVFVAAGIAKAGWLQVAGQAIRLGGDHLHYPLLDFGVPGAYRFRRCLGHYPSRCACHGLCLGFCRHIRGALVSSVTAGWIVRCWPSQDY